MKPPLKNNGGDDFQTLSIALDPLIYFLKKEWVIWECAKGKGNIVNYLNQKGFNVIGTDIKEGPQYDFLLYEPPQYDCIITNPPYSIKNEFLERAYTLRKPFAFLLPLTTLESAKRQKLFKKYGLEMILFDKRINFETPMGKGSGSWFATAWFCYGLNMGKELTFVELQYPKKDMNVLF
jgi:hypothetical protein